MRNKIKVVMLGGCTEQFEQYSNYPYLEVVVLASGNDLDDAISLGLKCFEADLSDIQGCLEIIINNDISVGLSAIFSFKEFGIEAASYIGEALGVLCNPLRPVVQTRNRHLMRQSLSKSSPELTEPFLVSNDKTAIREFVDTHELVIIKPIDGAGSKNVSLLAKGEPIPNLAGNIDKFVLEKFVEGREYSVESFSAYGEHKIVAITEKVTTHDAPFVELAHVIPASLHNSQAELIKAKVTKFLTEIGQLHGPAHTEIKITDQQVFIIESQTRLGGDRIWKLVELATGFNFIRAFVEAVLLKQEYSAPEVSKHVGIKFFTPKPGKLTAIEIPNELYTTDGIVDIHIAKKVGDYVPTLLSSSDRSGFGIVTANSRKGVELLLKELEKVKQETSDEH